MEEYSAAHTKHLEINFTNKNDSIEIILSTFKLISSFFPLCLFLLLSFFFHFFCVTEWKIHESEFK